MSNISDILTRVTEAIAGGNSQNITLEEVDALLKAYPYFTLPAALLCKHQADSLTTDQRRDLTAAVALSSPDPSTLYMLLEPSAASHARFYGEPEAEKHSTTDVIDTFLNTYGTTSPEEEALLNRLIFNPTPDYSQILAKEEEESAPAPGDAPEGSQDDRINRFIIKQKEAATPSPAPTPLPRETVETRRTAPAPETPADDTILSESLAKIFIKQHEYQRAFEIISELNLKYPEKSVYFADQLRFLSKIISNRARRNSRKQPD